MRIIAASAGGGFAAFYTFYAAAPVMFANASVPSGLRVAIVMLIVLAVQPLLLVMGPWIRDRRRTVLIAVITMGLGIATLHIGGHWPGSVLLGLGFGVFVVITTAWVKEQAPPHKVGKALGTYGFGSAAGGACGAPIGVWAAEAFGVPGVAVVGSAFAVGALLLARIAPHRPGEGRVEAFSHRKNQLSSPPKKTSRATGNKTSGVVVVSGLSHVLAVTIYATVLSSAGTSAAGGTAWIAVATAFSIQVSLALGRFAGGLVADRGLLAVSVMTLGFLVMGLIGFFWGPNTPVIVGASALVGLASGAGQTVALTVMMRQAQDCRGTERISALWNIGFDAGLGVGAVVAGSLPAR